MIEEKVWFTSTANSAATVGIDPEEPSHIHVPRPSRVARGEVGPFAMGPRRAMWRPTDREISRELAGHARSASELLDRRRPSIG